METVPRGTSLDPWYVTGFVDAAGSFTFSRSGRSVVLYFALKLTAQDQSVLEALRSYFGEIGTVYPLHGGASAYLRVCRLEQLERVVAHFEAYPLRGAKQAAFMIWSEMVRLKRSGFRKLPSERMGLLAARLSASSQRNA